MSPPDSGLHARGWVEHGRASKPEHASASVGPEIVGPSDGANPHVSLLVQRRTARAPPSPRPRGGGSADAGAGTRTRTPLRAEEFKSGAATEPRGPLATMFAAIGRRRAPWRTRPTVAIGQPYRRTTMRERA